MEYDASLIVEEVAKKSIAIELAKLQAEREQLRVEQEKLEKLRLEAFEQKVKLVYCLFTLVNFIFKSFFFIFYNISLIPATTVTLLV